MELYDFSAVPVESSNLETVDYNEQTKELDITFKSGHTYRYQNVSKYVYNNLLKAESKGHYFYVTIRKHPEKYPYKQIR